MKRKRFYLFMIFTLAALLCRAADVNLVSADGAWNVTVSTDAVTITPTDNTQATYTVPAKVSDAGGTDYAVTYTSSDESVVTVDAAIGAVTRVGVGTATITATAAETATDEASTARYSVTVYAEAVKYYVDEAGVEWMVKIEDADQMLLIPVDLTQETYTIYNKVTEKGTDHEYVVNGVQEGAFNAVSTVKSIDLSRVESLVTEEINFAEGQYENLTLSGSSFNDFPALESIVLPDCQSISGWKLLLNSPKLERVYLRCQPSAINMTSTNAGPTSKERPFYGVTNCTFYVDSQETYQAFMTYTCTEDDSDWAGQQFWAQFDAANNEVGNHYEFPRQPGLHFDGEEMTAYVGQRDVAGLPLQNDENLSNLTVAYTSSNTEVAQVDATTGVITPVAVGDATITASFEDDPAHMLLAETASYTLHISQVAAGLAYSKTEVECLFGDEVEWPVLSNEYNFPVTYTSSNEEVATVDAEGPASDHGNTGHLHHRARPEHEAVCQPAEGYLRAHLCDTHRGHLHQHGAEQG